MLPTGCDEDTTLRPRSSGTILGEVTGAGKPLEARVIAYEQSPEDDHNPRIRSESTTDSSGRCVLGVSPGRYLLRGSIHESAGSYFAYDGALSSEPADTIVATDAADPIRIDVRLGAVHLRADTPPEWEHLDVRASLRPSAEGLARSSGHGSADNGRVELLFPVVIPESYQVSIQSQSDQLPFWLLATHTQANADWIEVESPTEKLYESPIPSPATIAGRIGGRPLRDREPGERIVQGGSGDLFSCTGMAFVHR